MTTRPHQECAAAPRVRHPNVVTVFDAITSTAASGSGWVLTSRTLKDIVTERGPFSAQEAVVVGLDLCGALAAVHQAGCCIET